jgi:hypothetical protein
MPSMNPSVPVAFFIFNRPLPTRRVFDEIKKLKPAILLITADGPRHGADKPLVEATRKIVEIIDWPCDVRRNYSDINLGVKRRMYTGIDWVFSQFEQAILLEDDCLPDPTFFPYCTQLLEKHKDDDRIMMISGTHMLPGQRWSDDSYYYTVMTHIWGWATWRRAWQHYRADMPDWPSQVASGFPGDFVPSPKAAHFYSKMMADTYTGNLVAWGLAWMYAAWKRRAVSICPSVNLISNIGFGPDATHTRKVDPFANLPTQPMPFPLVHPKTVAANTEADLAFFKVAITGEYKNWRS